MERNSRRKQTVTRVLTDIHFWIPVGVLLAGLLLLRSIG